jgi:hypothetical protein
MMKMMAGEPNHSRTWVIEECFELTDRGTVVAVAEATGLPVNQPLRATVIRPDGSRLQAEARKEWLMRLNIRTSAAEAFLLMDIEKSDVPKGSVVELEVM